MTHIMVEGTSEPQPFQLRDDGVAFAGTGFEVSIAWRDDATNPAPAEDARPIVEWLNQAAGTVVVTETGEMEPGEYKFRWRVEDSLEQVGFIPNKEAAPYTWKVVRA